MGVHILNRIDPLRKQAERGADSAAGLSPMDPPDAYSPPSVDPVPAAEMHPYLRNLRGKHAPLMDELKAFEEAVLSVRNTGYTRESDARLRRFFQFLDGEFASLSRRDEAALLALLHERLIAEGEHGKGENPHTAVDLMEDECAKALQLAAVIVNFLGLAFRLPDERSRLVVLDAALEESKNLIELLRLLVFRKDSVLYTLAHRLISAAAFDALQSRAAVARKPS
ncbi:MAG: hypothetical protein HY661_02610 [Betaproteobacteria bacterium]|nr:hypothetical protein [Betaproteobacteria bacterium]